jgi:hypothetical protein
MNLIKNDDTTYCFISYHQNIFHNRMQQQQQTTNNKQQTTNNKQQTTNNKQQTTTKQAGK